METDTSYYESYEDLEVHKLMLKDSQRNQAYHQAIIDNKEQIKGKTVLDVGAGTGILSVYFAQAGAAKVYAVEASNIYKIAEAVMRENKVDHIVQVYNSAIEDVTLPEKVDIIVSEWMGFYLFHEAMLNSLIIARERFLKLGGLMFPESATLYASPCSVPSVTDDWQNIDGVSMTTFSEKLLAEATKKPLTIVNKPQDILTDPEVVVWIDLREVKQEEVDRIKVDNISVSNKVGKYQGLCLWFTCTFPSFTTEPVVLSTDPEDPPTHWKQTTIVLPTTIDVDKGTPIAYELCLTRLDNHQRMYNLEVTMLDADVIEHPEYCTCHLTKCILVRAMLDKYEQESLPN